MSFALESLQTAVAMISSMDKEVFDTVRTSLAVSAVSTFFAAMVGIPVGLLVGLHDFIFKRAIVTLLNTLMAMPTVVVGLFLYAFLSRQGSLGFMGLLFTPSAMIIGQTVLAAPIIANYTISVVQGADARIIPTALTLGASSSQATLKLLCQLRFGIIAALVAGFGRVIAEVGVAMMLGGNIRGYTRTMTTAIALETSKGEFAFGLAIGLILMAVALLINLFLNVLQQR